MAKRAVKAARNMDATVPVPAGNLQASPDRVADHLNNRIFFRLFQVANTLQRQAVKELGVTTVQWAVLGALSDPRHLRDGGGHVGRLPGRQPSEFRWRAEAART